MLFGVPPMKSGEPKVGFWLVEKNTFCLARFVFFFRRLFLDEMTK